MELNEVSRGKKWGNNNNNNNNQKCSSFSNNLQLQLQTPTKLTSGQPTRQAVGTKTKRLQDHLDTGAGPLRTH